MSKADPRDNRTSSKRETKPPSAPGFKPPLKPRPGLFIALLGLLVLWIVALVILYVRTVYPTRHQHVIPESEPVEKTIAR